MDQVGVGYGEAQTVGTPAELLESDVQRALVVDPLKPWLDNPLTLRAAAADRAPVPSVEAREGYYGERHLAYWLSGLDDYAKILQHTKLSAGHKILDFGGASGRIARHFAALEPECDVVIADLNMSHVNFVNRVFPANMRGITTSVHPLVPVADGTFNLVYAASVFTHIDVYETGWLSELDRVMAPDGVAWLTFHSEHTWRNMDGTPLKAKLNEKAEFVEFLAANPDLPSERLAFYYNEGQSYSCNIFHSSEYITRVWSRFFDIVAILPAEHAYHTVAVVKKKQLVRAAPERPNDRAV